VPPHGQPYLQTEARVAANGPGVEPVTFDIALERRPVVRGRLTDQVTGRPVVAWVEYRPLASNPNLKDSPNLAEWRFPRTTIITQADKDGRYVLPTLPGPGIVFVEVVEKYRPAPPDPAAAAKGAFDSQDPELLNTRPQPVIRAQTSAFRFIDPSADAGELPCDLTLDPGRSVTIRVVGPDGKAAPVVKMAGQRPVGVRFAAPVEFEGGTGQVFALASGEPRRLFLQTPDVRLAASRTLSGDETGTVEIRLQSTGAVTGTLVDEQGRPLVGVNFQVLYEDADGRACVLFPFGHRLPKDAEARRERLASGFYSAARLDLTTGPEQTDAQGRFTLSQLIPDLPFALRVQVTRPDGKDAKAMGRLIDRMQEVARTQVGSGQTVDLGTVRVAWGAKSK
jgi:hypothetical protein